MTPPQHLSAPTSPPPRLTDRAFPAYRHVPGLTPHPVTHPEGHSHGVPEHPVDQTCLDLPANWQSCPHYLHGIDLFNYAYHWEAHEEWEAIWHAVGHGSEPGQFLQGLIQVSAALLKHHMGVARGAASLKRKAFRRLDRVRDGWRGGGFYMGIDVEMWRQEVESWIAGGERFPFLTPKTDFGST